MMRRSLAAVAGAVLLTACGPTFDEDGLAAVEASANEAITAGEVAAMDIASVATGQEAEWANLTEHRDRLDAVSDAADGLPDRDEIASWTFNRTVAGEQFTVNGRELADAVTDLHEGVMVLADEADLLHGQGGNLTGSDLQWIEEALTAFADGTEDYRSVMFP